MGTKEEDKICPKCNNSDYDTIEESFSHLDDFFCFEYYCTKCTYFWSRIFTYIGVHIKSKNKI